MLHERLEGRRRLDIPKQKTKTENTSALYLASWGSAIQCAQHVGEQLRHASHRRVKAAPLRSLHGVVRDKDCSLEFPGSTHSI
jgi:hypothetical protein